MTVWARRAAPPKETFKLDSWGSLVAKLKLKGIDGKAPPGVELAAQFDSTRANLPGQHGRTIDRLKALSRLSGWWCMAVLSWWSDLSG